ncbi:PIKK family atypical protein kinase [Tritrichomonas foetus]|uniref:Serine/threonine-protein kinase TOR n=1 Tax=Tritrichomonas foetus TaxID=1144522 RepID=A0A1J4KS61_9EUKA|nr:PIKK family atypical protein kinase [Tritrichomonas foetus]|eukprot:OHT14099.1 PIKK family atypical protein kinase [Tritrichomonas foetus]
MELPKLPLTLSCESLIETCESYSQSLYLEMIRMSSISLTDYINNYLAVLENLMISPRKEDIIRASIGVVALHKLKFTDFDKIINIFNRLLPQTDIELVRFTSYCAGVLVHHPDTDQTQYVTHLFDRLIGWIIGQGRRQRVLAATYLLVSLLDNAGNSIALFIEKINTIIWHIISLPFPNLIVFEVTAKAIKLATISILRYVRGELNDYLNFCTELCKRLLFYSSSIKNYAGLLILCELIQIVPDYYIKYYLELNEMIQQTMIEGNCQNFVKITAFQTYVALAMADPKQFSEDALKELVEKSILLVKEYPMQTVVGLNQLSTIDQFRSCVDINSILSICNILLDIESFDSLFLLLEKYLITFQEPKLFDFVTQHFNTMIKKTISVNYKNFYVTLSKSSNPIIINLFKTDDFKNIFYEKIVSELESKVTLILLSEINFEFIPNPDCLFQKILKFENSKDTSVCCSVPAALFNLSKPIGTDKCEFMRKLLMKASMVTKMDVRCSYLEVLINNCCKEFADESFIKYYRILLNDDSFTVRLKALNILKKLVTFNPIAISTITRILLINSFNTLKNVHSIRQKARVARILPSLVSVFPNIIKNYTKLLVDTMINVLSSEFSMTKISNFIEENSLIEIQIGVINSVSVAAPYDKQTISQYCNAIIPLLCSRLNIKNNRLLVLSILNCLKVLLSPDASTIEIRTKSPDVLAACSSFLAQTNSQNARMAALEVVGTIGVLDVYQRPSEKYSESPKNIDDELARKFFHPHRDFDGDCPDTLLLQANTSTQYYIAVVSKQLLPILFDDTERINYHDTISVLVDVLTNPKEVSLPYFDAFVSRFLDILESPTTTVLEKKDYIPLVLNLIRFSHSSTSPFVGRVIDIIQANFGSELMIEMTELIIAFLEALKDGFLPYVSRTISLLITCLDGLKTTNIEVCKRVLHAFSLLGLFASDFRYLIIPQICDAISCGQTLRKVRIMSLDTLKELTEKISMFNYYGQILRALKFALSIDDKYTLRSALTLIYSLKDQAKSAQFLFEDLNEFCNSLTTNNDNNPKQNSFLYINNGSLYRLTSSFSASSQEFAVKATVSKPKQSYDFVEEVVIERAITPNLGLVQHLESWLNSLVFTVISSSPDPTIRSCHKIANSSSRFARKLFRPAFFSCWKKISENGKRLIASSFRELLLAVEPYENVAHEILELLAFMDKLEQPISIPIDDVINACIRYRYHAFALKLLEKKYLITNCNHNNKYTNINCNNCITCHYYRERCKYKEAKHTQKNSPHIIFSQNTLLHNHPSHTVLNRTSHDHSMCEINDNKNYLAQNTEDVLKLIDILLKAGSWNDAIAIWQMCFSRLKGLNVTNVFSKLRMWDKAEEQLRESFLQTKNPNVFRDLIESLSKLAKWNDIFDFYSTFNSIKKHQKQEVSQFFAQAAMYLGKWTELDNILQYSPINSSDCNMLIALNCLHKHDWNGVDKYVTHGFSLLASRPITFWEEDQRIIKETMMKAQQLIEINEMKDWLLNPQDVSEQQNIELIWNSRLKTAPKDLELWFDIISNRIQITQKRDQSLIQFFSLNSLELGTKIHNNTFDTIFPNFDWSSSPDLDKLCYVVANWYMGEKVHALEKIEELRKESSPNMKIRVNFFNAVWLLESDDTVSMLSKAYKILKESIDILKTKHYAQPSLSSYSSLPSDIILGTQMLRCIKSMNSDLCYTNHIMKYLVSDIVKVDVYRKWASVNYSLVQLNKSIESDKSTKYINNALNALNECAKIMPEFPDVVQLIHIFFENAGKEQIFKTNKSYIQHLPHNLLLQAFPQLLVQLSHRTPEVQNFVHGLIFELLKKHFHTVIFQIFVLERSKNHRRAKSAHSILCKFKKMYPKIYEEVNLIRHVLLHTAVTYYEKALFKLNEAADAEDRQDTEEVIRILSTIFKFAIDEERSDQCMMQRQFLREYGDTFRDLCRVMNVYSSRPTQYAYQTIMNVRNSIEKKLEDQINKIKMIQLNSISPEIVSKSDFNLAVFGTYKANKPLIKISYFVGQIGVFPTKQRPKNLCIKGDDGNFYQYLLKGHEDMRLDERIMQFFKLVNSLIKKETSNNARLIETYAVIPLSFGHGLVQFVRGTDTLKKIIIDYRKMHHREKYPEYTYMNNLSISNFDTLLPHQKMQIILKINKELPDSDVANYFWLKARNPETWMKHSRNFSISNAINSIVGYIIGLGDRHPSNLLIKRSTGKVVHIDFGDCFERAANRKILPETVPFRLSRMMIRAMGISGINGTFRTEFIHMSTILRENRRVLLQVLSLFVNEPLVDPDNVVDSEIDFKGEMQRSNSDVYKKKRKKTLHAIRSNSKNNINMFTPRLDTTCEIDFERESNEKIRDRVKKKLMGKDFEDGVILSVEEQADRLMSDATSYFKMAKMYHGWFPFW